jgi:hypothetical protein
VKRMNDVKFHIHVMPHRLCILACALLNAAQITAVFAADLNNNPFATESLLPYHYPAFDKIKDEHFVPAIQAGMREQLKEIEPIANSSEKARFDTTIVALERTGRLALSPTAYYPMPAKSPRLPSIGPIPQPCTRFGSTLTISGERDAPR